MTKSQVAKVVDQIAFPVGVVFLLSLVALIVNDARLSDGHSFRPFYIPFLSRSQADVNAESAALQVQGNYSFVSEGDSMHIHEGEEAARFVIVLRQEDGQKIGFRVGEDQKFLSGQSVHIKYIFDDYYVFSI